MNRLSEKVGLSLSACHRRVKLLEANGMPSRITPPWWIENPLVSTLQIFIEVKLTSHYKEDQTAFRGQDQGDAGCPGMPPDFR